MHEPFSHKIGERPLYANVQIRPKPFDMCQADRELLNKKQAWEEANESEGNDPQGPQRCFVQKGDSTSGQQQAQSPIHEQDEDQPRRHF